MEENRGRILAAPHAEPPPPPPPLLQAPRLPPLLPGAWGCGTAPGGLRAGGGTPNSPGGAPGSGTGTGRRRRLRTQPRVPASAAQAGNRAPPGPTEHPRAPPGPTGLPTEASHRAQRREALPRARSRPRGGGWSLNPSAPGPPSAGGAQRPGSGPGEAARAPPVPSACGAPRAPPPSCRPLRPPPAPPPAGSPPSNHGRASWTGDFKLPPNTAPADWRVSPRGLALAVGSPARGGGEEVLSDGQSGQWEWRNGGERPMGVEGRERGLPGDEAGPGPGNRARGPAEPPGAGGGGTGGAGRGPGGGRGRGRDRGCGGREWGHRREWGRGHRGPGRPGPENREGTGGVREGGAGGTGAVRAGSGGTGGSGAGGTEGTGNRGG